MSSDSLEAPRRTDWPRVIALAALTAIGIFLCFQLTWPFLPGVIWAVALAVLGLPLHRRIARWVSNANWAAGLSTAVVVLVIAIPVMLVVAQLAAETVRVADTVREHTQNGRWRETVARVPLLGELLGTLDAREVEGRARGLVERIASRSSSVVEGAIGGFLQALVAVFVLFFCFRDRHHLLAGVRDLIPLSPAASDRVIGRADDAIHATVYGTILTGAIQGVTGGLLFWALGLPAPILWGAVMFVLSVLPIVGAFLVWVPAAAYLMTEDRWAAALALVAWGLLMAGPVCNFVYAWAAGDRMRMHPVPTLLAFIGGLAVFGISGMVLGPCVLAVTVALIDIWRNRLPDGTPVATRTPAPASVNARAESRAAVR